LFPYLKDRIVVPERMDDPTLSPTDHKQALRGLQRINRWTGNAKVVWRPIRFLAESLRLEPMTVLDVATGSGDVPVQMLRFAERRGIHLDVHACDISQTALDFAKGSHKENTSISFFLLDIISDPIPQMYDVVTCTTFLHHLARNDAHKALAKMRDAARRQVVIVDLERGTLNWLLVWLGCHVLTRSSIVHFDGPQSVRAAFTMSEIRSIAVDVGFRSLRLYRSWPCRFVLVGDV